MKRIALLLIAACSSSKSAVQDAHLDVQTEARESDVEHREIHADQQTVTLSVRQPSEVVEEFFAPTPDGGVVLTHRIKKVIGIRETSTGINRDYVASSDGLRGAEQDTSLQAQAHAETHVERSVGPPWWLWLLAAGALAAFVGLVWKLKPPWLGWLWKLIG